MQLRVLFACLGSIITIGLLIAINCASPPRAKRLEPHAPFTLRAIGMGPLEFIEAADQIVQSKTPQWWVGPDIVKTHIAFGMLDNYATTYRDNNSEVNIVIGRPALVLSTVEDLAMVLLHEYTHIKIYEAVYANSSLEHLPLECKFYRGEMWANKVAIELYHRLRYRRDFLVHSIHLYTSSRTTARSKGCPQDTFLEMPKYVLPLDPYKHLPPGPPRMKLPGSGLEDDPFPPRDGGPLDPDGPWNDSPWDKEPQYPRTQK
jgi:hypothetical protein